MIWLHCTRTLMRACRYFLFILIVAPVTLAQVNISNTTNVTESTISSSTISNYVDPVQGSSSIDLVRRALNSNQEIAAIRLDIERARARLRQAGLRPNPSIDFEQATGRLAGSPGERETTVGVSFPIELGGKRQRRLDLAQAELAAAEAEVADRERKLIGEARAAYAEALAALREMDIADQLNNVDLETNRIVDIRVKEGDAAPLELNLLQVEVDRLKSRRALVEGRLQAALLKLKSLTGIPLEEPLKLREELLQPLFGEAPASLDEAIALALNTRPDLKLAKLNETVAKANLNLARAQATPDLTLFSKYSVDRSLNDLPSPLVPVPDTSKRLSFGVSIGIPIFNRNQGTQAEANVAITQAERRSQFAEQLVIAEVKSAYVRYQAANNSIQRFEQGVIARSTNNIRVVREAYQLGEFKVTDLLAEQRRLVDSQREFTEALAERYRALADLYLAIGNTNP